MIKVRGLRRHIVAQVVVCLLLSWAAADLLVPQLCNVEQAQQSDSPRAPQDQDDCFCCCAHVVRSNTVQLVFVDMIPVVREPSAPADLATGVPPSVYRPPLQS